MSVVAVLARPGQIDLSVRRVEVPHHQDGPAGGTLGLEETEQPAVERQLERNARQVALEAVDFQHIANMKAGFDGAWLAFQNFEGVEARHEDVDAVMIRTADAGIPNFSALELFTSRGVYDRHRGMIDRLRAVMDRAIAAAQADTAFARDVYYRQSKTEPSALMDAIIEDTVPRLIAPVRPLSDRWHALWRDFHGRGLIEVTEADYLALFPSD